MTQTAIAPKSPDASAPKELGFNCKLGAEFIKIAQPFFFPIKPLSWLSFCWLLVMLLFFAYGFVYFLEIGLTFLGEAIAKDFFVKVAEEQIKKAHSALGSAGFWVALGSLAISTGSFFLLQRNIRQKWRPWAILSSLVVLAFLVTKLNVILTYSIGFIDNALNEKQPDLFWQFLIVYGLLLVVAIPILVSYGYIRRKLSLYWRDWLTKSYLNSYFRDRAYYNLDSNATDTKIDNPDQRITEDIKAFTTTVLDLLLDILSSLLDLVAFSVVLYNISRDLVFGLLGQVALGTVIAIIIGVKLLKINFSQLKLEANFRYGMVHIRDNSESIAFYRGEELEKKEVGQRLGSAIKNYNLLIIWFAFLGVFQYAYQYFSRIFPYLIVAPLYFAGKKDFGSISQAFIAFSIVLSALSLIPNRIQDIAAFSASIGRLGVLSEQLEPGQLEEGNHKIKSFLGPNFKLDHLTLNTPHSERTLFRDLTLSIGPQESLLVIGSSGAGKSSLNRAIAGLWTNGEGMIETPDPTSTLFLPQKPYMLLGSLREQIIYPNMRDDVTDGEIQNALDEVGLGDIAERFGGLEAVEDWATILSLGEQQRLAMTRILINRPKHVILDEATSALDIPNERRFYELLQSMNLGYISVGHRPSLLDYHQTILEIGGEQTWRLRNKEEMKAASQW